MSAKNITAPAPVAPVAMPVEAKKPVAKAKAPKAASGTKKAKATHPAWAEMITSAVKALSEKGGSSISAIKKYMAANYKIEADKATPFMRRGIKAAIASGTLIQAKGKGLTGSFKVPKAKPAGAAKAKKVVKKPATTTGQKLKTKKVASPKKAGVKKITKKPKAAGAATPAKPKKAKTATTPAKPKKVKAASPKKTITAKKPAAAKPKPAAKKAAGATPKPKTKATKKAASPKKATAVKPKLAKSLKAPKAPKPKTTKKVAPKKAATAAAAPSAPAQ